MYQGVKTNIFSFLRSLAQLMMPEYLKYTEIKILIIIKIKIIKLHQQNNKTPEI
jgi:hypothetical protein